MLQRDQDLRIVFNDEKQMQGFLSLNEEGKYHFPTPTYSPSKGEILDSLVAAWDVDRHFQGEYLKDHQALCNALFDDITTCWADKYSTTIYSYSMEGRNYQLQPIPDYLRWFRTGEAHYLPLEVALLLKGSWITIPAVFLPSKVLELCFIVVPHPDDIIIHQMSLLSWLTVKEVKEYQRKLEVQLELQLQAEKEKIGGNLMTCTVSTLSRSWRHCVENPTFPWLHLSTNVS